MNLLGRHMSFLLPSLVLWQSLLSSCKPHDVQAVLNHMHFHSLSSKCTEAFVEGMNSILGG